MNAGQMVPPALNRYTLIFRPPNKHQFTKRFSGKHSTRSERPQQFWSWWGFIKRNQARNYFLQNRQPFEMTAESALVAENGEFFLHTRPNIITKGGRYNDWPHGDASTQLLRIDNKEHVPNRREHQRQRPKITISRFLCQAKPASETVRTNIIIWDSH